ncbi:hypothetical protein [Sulfurimonas sp.]
MQIAQYTFQSPYPSPIQVGRLDTSSLKDNSNSKNESDPAATTDQTQRKATMFEEKMKQKAHAVVRGNDASQGLDLYV